MCPIGFHTGKWGCGLNLGNLDTEHGCTSSEVPTLPKLGNHQNWGVGVSHVTMGKPHAEL